MSAQPPIYQPRPPPPHAQAPPPASASVWAEYRNPQGRPYWYHTIDKRSVWEKPAELKTPRERALDSTPWKEYQSPDGRSYYVHAETRQTTWNLPPEVKALVDQYSASDSAVGPAGPSSSASPYPAAQPVGGPPGAQSPAAASPLRGGPVPVRPAGYGPGPATLAAEAAVPGSPAYGPGGHAGGPRPGGPSPGFPTAPHASLPVRPPLGAPQGPAMSPGGSASPIGTPNSAGVATGSATPSATNLPQRPPPSSNLRSEPVNFRGDKDAAEAAFISLLEQKRVDVDWTWEVTMRAVITEPLYKALKTIAERKNAFAKYIDRLKRQRAEERAQRLERLRPLFKALVAESGSKIKSYSSFATFKKLCGQTSAFKEARDDDEARAAFDAVIKELKEAELAHAREIRHRNMDMLMSLLKTFEADVLTRWRDAHRTVVESDEYAQDAHLKTMDVADMLIVFDEHMKSIEKEAVEAKRRQEAQRKRKERKNRDEFKKLLDELKERGDLTSRSTWGSVFAKIKDDDRFLRLIGQPGSTPLDLFYDAVDALEATVEKHIEAVQVYLAKEGKEVRDTTTAEEFTGWLAASAELSALPDAVKEAVYHHMHSTLLHKAAEDRRRAERKRRHAIDDLRYAMKKVDNPPLDIEAALTAIVPRISHLPEYTHLKDDAEALELAWDKYVKRARERMASSSSHPSGAERRRSIGGGRGRGRTPDDEESAAASRKRKERDASASSLHRRPRSSSNARDRARSSVEPPSEARKYGHASRRDRERGGGLKEVVEDVAEAGTDRKRVKTASANGDEESEEEEGQV